MISFPQLGEFGRLGNQLFQYAALKSLALKRGFTAKIPNPETKNWHGQDCLLGEFNIECEYLNDSDYSNFQWAYHEPDWRTYDPNFFSTPDNTCISGYFQSMFYFEEFEDQIRKELTPKAEFINEAKSYIDSLKAKYPNHEIVSVHVRRGDNMTNNQEALIKAFDEGGVYETYFNLAKKQFSDKLVKFLVFTGGQRFNEDNSEDFNWCKEFFKGDEFIFSEGQSQINDFCRIMLCDHNILSHVSSFGWWAAYQNTNPNKIVVAPKSYNPEYPDMDRPKFYPKNYILL
jgi:hypothetical protein